MSRLLLAAVSLVLLLCVEDAHAFKRSSTHTGPKGGQTKVGVETTGTDSGYTRSKDATGPGGQSYSKDSTGSYNKETNTWNRSTTRTGPRGKSSTSSHETTISR